MSESRLFPNTTEPEQLTDAVTETTQELIAGDTVADTQPTDDTSANVSEQTGSKKQRRKRTKQSNDADIAVADTADTANSDVEDVAEESTPEKQYKTGDPIDIRLALLYSSSAAPKHFKGIKGRYYIWNDTAVNSRVRLTDSPSGVGKPERIIGWVEIKNIL